MHMIGHVQRGIKIRFNFILENSQPKNIQLALVNIEAIIKFILLYFVLHLLSIMHCMDPRNTEVKYINSI